MTKKQSMAIWGFVVLIILVYGLARLVLISLGRQPDGSFLVSPGHRIKPGSIALTGRPINLALHPIPGGMTITHDGTPRESTPSIQPREQ
jgi:hypothetical protein